MVLRMLGVPNIFLYGSCSDCCQFRKIQRAGAPLWFYPVHGRPEARDTVSYCALAGNSCEEHLLFCNIHLYMFIKYLVRW